MREKLNSNPVAQAAILAVLLLATGFFVLSSMGGGGEEEEGAASPAAESIVAAVAASEGSGVAAAPPPGALAATAPPPPAAVMTAFAANRTVVLLFVRDGGIDDRLVLDATRSLNTLPGVATFVVSAKRIARYAAIAQGVDVNRVPALVVLRPKRLNKGIATASVTYGFQSPQSVVQAVVDAGYQGRTLGYHP
jgi:hypothetical protein